MRSIAVRVQRHVAPRAPRAVAAFSTRPAIEADVAIIGGGTGGLAVAGGLYTAGASVGKKVVVIDPATTHFYQPLWTLVGGGKKELSESGRPLAPMVHERGADLVQAAVTEIDAPNNTIRTNNGQIIRYKSLVVACGLELKLNKVKGLRESLGRGGVTSNYVYPYAERTAEFIRKLRHGQAIFTLPSGPMKCAGAPQKIMYLAEDHWRKEGLRDHIDISFNTALPAIFGVPYYANTLLRHCESVGIRNLNFGLDLVEIKPDSRTAVFKRVLADAKSDGKVGDVVTQSYDFLHVSPPQGPWDWVAQSKLGNAAGWLDVDPATLQHTKHSNVWGVGDITSCPTSKTAVAAGAEARAVVAQLTKLLQAPSSGVAATSDTAQKYDGYTACPLTMGDNKLVLAEFNGYTGAPLESMPCAQSKRRRSMYFLKSEVMPILYWNRMLWGQSDVPLVRKLSAPIRPFVHKVEQALENLGWPRF